MTHSRPDSVDLETPPTETSRQPRLSAPGRSDGRIAVLLGSFILCTTLVSVALPSALIAQDWEGDYEGSSTSTSSGRLGDRANATGWSLRVGLGFIGDPTAFLLNFEVPYAFDRWVSAGPMVQVGLDDNNTVVAPSLNVTVRVPDLPGSDYDRIHPFGFVGIGFAYIEDDNRNGDNSSFGFLVNFGLGLEYQVSENLALGSQMMFNFLPEETLEQHFFYSWQVLGARIAF